LKKKNTGLALIMLLAFVLLSAVILISEGRPGDFGSSGKNAYSLQISEICTKNVSVIANNEGKYPDYIEIYNGGEALSLEGFTITDGKVSCSPFGSTRLDSGEYLVVFLGNDITGFALSASGGDCVQLLDPEGNIVSQANTAALTEDQVMLLNGLVYENSGEASPGYPNNAAGRAAFTKGSRKDTVGLEISEILLGNVSSLPDEQGIYCDVIELHNTAEESVNLRRYCLSDNELQRYRFRLPDRELAPGERVIIFCDGSGRIGENGEIHASFAISHGESLILTNSHGEYSLVTALHMGDDISQAVDAEGNYSPSQVSLGYENSDEGAALFMEQRINRESPLVISEVLLSSADVPYKGAFVDLVEILNASAESLSTVGWYLTDGGDPMEYPLPERTLKPGECMVVVCSSSTTGFSLSEGESIYLTAPDSRKTAPLVCTEGQPGKSLSLLSGEMAEGYDLALPTPGYPNTEAGLEAYCESICGDGLQISELMSANQSYLKGPYATTADWIELYNASKSALNLSGYHLSDRSSDTERYVLPDITLDAGEYCVIFLKADTTNLAKGYETLPFSLSSAGEQLYLCRDGAVVDYVLLPELSTDEAYGRPEGKTGFSLLAAPSPGWANSAAAEKCAMPQTLTAQGCYDGIEYLDVVLSGDGDIYYTTDCRIPTADSKLYTGPIRITETTIIRAVVCGSGKMDSEILNLSYIVNENDNLPVVSLVTVPENLWDPGSGIYVLGPNAEEEFPFFGANYWMDWEKPANVSLFETDGGGFSANCGIKIFGGFTVTMEKKSLACHFRDVYGESELNYPLFGESSFDSYESFVLRTTGQDAYRARMRDVLVTSLFSQYTDVPVQKYKPVIVYLNGEYWGLHYIREKINSNYLAAHYNSAPDELTVVKLGGWTSPEYIELVKYTASHDMTIEEHYNYVCSQIDVDNYIDFMIAEIWIANTDNGNVKYFVSPEGKWTWLLYDTDLSLQEYDLNSIGFYMGSEAMGTNDTTCKTFVAKMIHNEEFRDKFLSRMAWQMNNIWTEENINSTIDEICAMIGEDMPRECLRWDHSYSSWEDSVESIRVFAERRNEYLLEYIQGWFGLSDKEMRAYGFDI